LLFQFPKAASRFGAFGFQQATFAFAIFRETQDLGRSFRVILSRNGENAGATGPWGVLSRPAAEFGPRSKAR